MTEDGTLQDETYYDEVRNYKGTFDEMRAKELAKFSGALDKFNQAKLSYKGEYDKVATNYQGIENAINKCKANCANDSKTKGESGKMGAEDHQKMWKTFCQAGCTFKGPQLVNSCTDTWQGLKTESNAGGNNYSKGAQCSAFHDICDKNNNRVSRNQHDNEVLQYKDIKNKKLKDACCGCGGGAGGIPKYSYDDIFHKSCESLKLHACDGSSHKCGNSVSTLMNVCGNPVFKESEQSQSITSMQQKLKTAYDKVVQNNNIMRDRGKFLFDQINTYDKQINKLNNEKNNEEETYDQIISNYIKTNNKLKDMYGISAAVADGANNNPNTNYSDIMAQKEKMSKDWSRDVMVEESKLRRRSEEMKFWMWSLLAIVVGWATIINFRKKVA